VILPKGDWFNYWTGERMGGGRTIQVEPPLDTLPVYVRAGTILPQQPVVQNVEETPQGGLELRVYPGPDCRGDLYADEGNTLAYQRGEFLRAHFTCEAGPDRVNVHIEKAVGPYRPWFKDVQVTVYGAGKVREVTVDGKPPGTWKAEGGTVKVESIPWTGTTHDVQIEYSSQ
jgi:alpha-glucosidase